VSEQRVSVAKQGAFLQSRDQRVKWGAILGVSGFLAMLVTWLIQVWGVATAGVGMNPVSGDNIMYFSVIWLNVALLQLAVGLSLLASCALPSWSFLAYKTRRWGVGFWAFGILAVGGAVLTRWCSWLAKELFGHRITEVQLVFSSRIWLGIGAIACVTGGALLVMMSRQSTLGDVGGLAKTSLSESASLTDRPLSRRTAMLMGSAIAVSLVALFVLARDVPPVPLAELKVQAEEIGAIFLEALEDRPRRYNTETMDETDVSKLIEDRITVSTSASRGTHTASVREWQQVRWTARISLSEAVSVYEVQADLQAALDGIPDLDRNWHITFDSQGRTETRISITSPETNR